MTLPDRSVAGRARRAASALVSIASLGSFGAPRAALAQEPPSRAVQLFDQAMAEVARGELGAACGHFAESQAAEPAPGTLYNLGLCERQRGRPAAAVAAFELLSAQLPPGDPHEAEVRDLLATLEPRVARLTITLAAKAPEATRVSLDGALLEPPMKPRVPLEPGPHVVVASVGEASRSFEVTLAAGRHARIEVTPFAPHDLGSDRARDAQPDRSARAPAPNAARSGSGRRTAALVCGGLGLSGVVVGTVAGLRVLSLDRSIEASGCEAGRCDSHASYLQNRDRAREGATMSVVSTAAFGVGLVGLAAATLLVVTASPSASPPEHAAVRRRARGGTHAFAWASPGAAAVGLRGALPW